MQGMHYPPAEIHNSTEHRCDGRILYSDGHEEAFATIPWDTWTSPSDRGLLLIRRIEGRVIHDDGLQVDAYAYASVGSAHSQFAILKQRKDFVISRIVYHNDDVDTGTFSQ
jgi:hypothetical protein